MAATGGRTVRGEERPGSFFGDAEGGLSGWEAREEWFEAGLAESRRDAEECRMWEGREKDCSKGFGSKSKSERVWRRDWRCWWWWSEGDSAFFVGVGMTSRGSVWL